MKHVVGRMESVYSNPTNQSNWVINEVVKAYKIYYVER